MLREIPCDIKYLESKLHETYKRFFPFGTVKSLKKYLSGDGVIADYDKKGNPIYKARIKQNPLRIEVHHLPTQNKVIAWQMNGV